VKDWSELYREKFKDPEEIVKAIGSGMVCASPCALGEPMALTHALAERALSEDLSGISHHLLLPLHDHLYLQPELKGKMHHVSWFTSGFARKAVNQGRADFMPCHYHDAASFWREKVHADVFYAAVSSMDKHGYFSFGGSASLAMAQMERADMVFLEVNRHVPRCHGRAWVHISQVDALCEHHRPLFEWPNPPVTRRDEIIGKLIADRIPDGATIQLGIGGIPNAVAKNLMGKRDIGVHSEMFTEGMVELIEAGVITNCKKEVDRYKCISSFCGGSKRMYDYLDDNPFVEFHPIEYVNDPWLIAKFKNFVSINSTVEVDLLGQACSESIGPRQYSGTGGQVDFVRGATLASGGQSFLACYSTTKNHTISKITSQLTPGAHVTCSKSDIDCVVTEYGIAELRGKSAAQRAKALIGIAHPKHRDRLTQEARGLNLML
jgi:4-hydroxybutyrate CoA-transferase